VRAGSALFEGGVWLLHAESNICQLKIFSTAGSATRPVFPGTFTGGAFQAVTGRDPEAVFRILGGALFRTFDGTFRRTLFSAVCLARARFFGLTRHGNNSRPGESCCPSGIEHREESTKVRQNEKAAASAAALSQKKRKNLTGFHCNQDWFSLPA
jgi:hypothetical protein